MSDDEIYSEPSDTGDKPLVPPTKLSVPPSSTAPGGSTISAKREKSPTAALRDKSPSGARDNANPVASGSLLLKVVTQQARVNGLRALLSRLTEVEATAFTLSELDGIQASAKELWASFSRVHDLITESCSVDFLESEYVKDDTFTMALDLRTGIITQVGRFRDQLQPPARDSSGTPSSGSTSTSGGRVLLPEISLPSFTGAYSQWCSFRDLFTALVRENKDITDVMRMHYLRASTSGEAAKLIASLAIEADSFATAWETLLERYENKRILVSSHLESLLQTRVIAPRSARDLHALLHNITEACNSLKALGAPIEHWDWVLVHATSRRLDNGTREAWEIKAGQSQEPPSFNLMRTFLTNRARALEGAEVGKPNATTTSSVSSGTNSRPSSRVHTVTTGSSGKSCSYCQEEHYIVSCPKFRNLTREARREQVKTLRLCYNCLGQHNVMACRTTTKCKECDRKHHTMIHVGWSKNGDPSNSSGTPQSGGATGPTASTSADSSSAPTSGPTL